MLDIWTKAGTFSATALARIGNKLLASGTTTSTTTSAPVAPAITSPSAPSTSKLTLEVKPSPGEIQFLSPPIPPSPKFDNVDDAWRRILSCAMQPISLSLSVRCELRAEYNLPLIVSVDAAQPGIPASVLALMAASQAAAMGSKPAVANGAAAGGEEVKMSVAEMIAKAHARAGT